MPVSVLCPSCGTKVTGSDNIAGKVVRCPNCKLKIQIPDAADSEQANASGSKNDVDVDLIESSGSNTSSESPSQDSFDFDNNAPEHPMANPNTTQSEEFDVTVALKWIAAGLLVAATFCWVFVSATERVSPLVSKVFVILTVGMGIGCIIITIAWIYKTNQWKCPECHQVGEPIHLKSKLIARTKELQTIWRDDYDNFGKIVGRHQEQVQFVRKTYLNYYQCSSCKFEWSEESVEAYEG